MHLSGKTLTAGTDYTVTFSNNTNIGTASVTITGIGGYTGSKTLNFTITAAGQPNPGGNQNTGTTNQQGENISKPVKTAAKPKIVTLSSVKSNQKKAVTVKWKKVPRASGYIVQLSTDKKFKKDLKKVTISKSKTVSKTVGKLKAGKKYYVRVCAYVKSGGKKIQGKWSKAKTVKVK